MGHCAVSFRSVAGNATVVQSAPQMRFRKAGIREMIPERGDGRVLNRAQSIPPLGIAIDCTTKAHIAGPMSESGSKRKAAIIARKHCLLAHS
jgi:hypothetical protein